MAIDTKILKYSFVIFLSGLLMLVTSAMGVQCSNECEKYKNNNKNNHVWLSVMLGLSVFMVVGSLIGFYFGFSGKTVSEAVLSAQNTLQKTGAKIHPLSVNPDAAIIASSSMTDIPSPVVTANEVLGLTKNQ